HHGEGVEVHLRKTLLQAAQHLAVPVERQLGMQTAHDVEFGDGFGPTLARDMPNLIERHGVRFRVFGSLSEGAQPATGYADVGGIDVPVDVEIGGGAMQTLAHQIRHVPQRENVRGLIERHAVVIGQARASLDFLEDRTQTRIFDERLHGYARRSNSTSAAQNTKNSTLTQPFMVKNAAFTRERSSAFTRVCSYTSNNPTATIPATLSAPRSSTSTSASRHTIIRTCSNCETLSARRIPIRRGRLNRLSATSNS